MMWKKNRKNSGQVASPQLFLNVCVTFFNFIIIILDTLQITLSSSLTNEFLHSRKNPIHYIGRDIPIAIEWVVYGSTDGVYIYNSDHKYPFSYP